VLSLSDTTRSHHLFCFFFFQAEDGIRDFHVTGVQTCALPISSPCGGGPAAGARPPRRWPQRAGGGGRKRGRPARTAGRSGSCTRSEERRVGKECRPRWSPYE